LWFSPSGDLLLFASFDDSKVGTVTLQQFETDKFLSKDLIEYQMERNTAIRYSKVKIIGFSNKRFLELRFVPKAIHSIAFCC